MRVLSWGSGPRCADEGSGHRLGCADDGPWGTDCGGCRRGSGRGRRRALSAPTRVVDTSARYIPLAVSTTPSRCQRPPHGADNARPYRQRALELAPGPTTRVHTRGSTRARAGRAADTADNAHCPVKHPRQGRARCGRDRRGHDRPHPLPGGTPAPGPGPGGLLRIVRHPLGVRTQGPRFKKQEPHTRAESRPCVRRRVV